MGISGLLPQLKDITHKTHIREFAGKTAAIDGYVWLYKGAYCCPQELCEGVPTDKFVKYCMAMVQVLLHHNVKPYVVLDGDKLPAKAMTENNRFSSRTANKERGRQLAAQGNDRAAMEMYQKAVEATPEMARTFIEALKQAGVPFVVAPYEADAQMAYMARNGIVDLVITEDSDLLAYGCPEVIFKLSRGGDCDHIRSADLPMNRTLSFSGLDHDNFIEMCILAGCDFVASLPGMGIKKAHAGVKRFRSFVNVIKSAKINRTKVPQGYEVEVQRAYWTFKHQRVWCPRRKTMVHLNDLPNSSIADSRLFIPAALPSSEELTDLSFLGPVKSDDINSAIARGEINPMTHLPFKVERVGDILHVTTRDRNSGAQQLTLAPPPRSSAPALLQPHRHHVGLVAHRQPSLGLYQAGTGSRSFSHSATQQLPLGGNAASRSSAPTLIQRSSSAPIPQIERASMDLFAVSDSSQCTASDQSPGRVQTTASQPTQSAAIQPQTQLRNISRGTQGAIPVAASVPAVPWDKHAGVGVAVMRAGRMFLKKSSPEAAPPTSMKEKLLALLGRETAKCTSADPSAAPGSCTKEEPAASVPHYQTMVRSSSLTGLSCQGPSGSAADLDNASQPLTSQHSGLCSTSGLSQDLSASLAPVADQDTEVHCNKVGPASSIKHNCGPRSALSLLAAAGNRLLGKRKLQQHVESACDKLQAVRSSDNNSTGAFGWDVENYMLDLQADIKCIGVLGVPAGTGRVGTGEPQQQLKFRLSKTHKKTLVESHPIAGTLSDVLQESKSTQSAMNIAINDDNLGEDFEAQRDPHTALSPGPSPEAALDKEKAMDHSPACLGVQEVLMNPLARLASLRQATTSQTVQGKQKRSVESLPGSSDPGDSPGGDDEAGNDRKSLLESFKVSTVTSNQFKKPRRHKAIS